MHWARGEREKRWKCMLAFEDSEHLGNESEYFKEHCIPWVLKSAETKYKDIVIMLHEDKKEAQLVKRKYERVVMFEEEMSRLCQTANEICHDISKQLEQSEGKKGRKEEQEFWKKAERCAKEKQNMLELKYSKVASL